MKVKTNISSVDSREPFVPRGAIIDAKHRIPVRDNFFTQLELTHIKNTLYKTKEEEFIGGQIFAQTNQWQAGAREVGYDFMEPVGNARIGAQGGKANDIPNVSEKLVETTQKAIEIEIAISYTRNEIEAADAVNTLGRGANLKLVNERGMAARRSVSRAFDQGIFQGYSAYGLKGLQDIIPNARQGSLPTDNNTTAYESVPATGTGSSTLWSDKSGQNIIKDLVRGKINGVERGKIFAGNDLIVDTEAYSYLLNPYSDLQGKSIISYINEAKLFKNIWVTNAVAKANNNRNNTYFVICDTAEDIAEIAILRPLTVFPSQQDYTGRINQLVAMRYAGLLVKYKAGFYFGDGHIEAPA